jgi:pimeloyl-ACP methyl ester carboxylesterase
MPRWLKITLGVVAAIIVLVLLNSVVVSSSTKDAYLRDSGAQLVDTVGGRLQVLQEGNPDGSPVVLVHCYTCSMRWWDELAPLLERDHRVIRVDLLGHGGSDKPGGGYPIDEQASAVAEALAKLGVVDATVVGHSLGGTVATALAEQSPRLASRIVIIDQAPDDSFEDESFTQRLSYWPVIGQAEARLAEIVPKSLVRDQYEEVFAPGYSIASGFEDPDQPVDDLRAMTYTAFKETHEEENDFVGETPLDERMAATALPLLVIFGAEDQVYDAEEAIAGYRANAPGAETHLVPGAGHSPNVERPAAVAQLLRAFARPPKKQKPARKPASKKQAPQEAGQK